MKLKKLIVLPLAFLLTTSAFSQEADQSRADGVKKLDMLLSVINYAYVDPVKNEKLVEDAIVGMLEELDPHSVYIPEKELKAMNEPLEGNFEGIGIQFNIFKDTLMVVFPIQGGPSEKLGIMAGDKIITIDKENVAGVGLTNSMVQAKLRGKKGTTVDVEIKRKGEKKLIPYTIERDKIPLYSVDATYMATPEIGYIKVNRFARNTMDEFNEGIVKLKSQGAKHLILDLRGNGGGYLQTAVQMADELLGQGKLIVYTEGDKQRKEEYKATSRGAFEKGKIAILIDEGSASASEIVSGAVQDSDRGMIIGRRSFGKGLVQKSFPLTDGSAIRLTTARYYTPTGRSIQRPYDDGKDAYYKEMSRRYDAGELVDRDSINFPDSLKFYTPNGRLVYGGGGIMPDIFIPLDTNLNTDLNRALIRRGVYNEFTLTYLDKNRKKLLKEYTDLDQFKKNFQIDEEVIEELSSFSNKKNVDWTDSSYQESKKLVDIQLKALLARNLFDTSAYFEIINELNDSYLEAINVIQSDKFEKAKLEFE